ncbi:MAG: hypothetical protein FLDDKLPJ_03163 [Phycisphaerae bacterium]|nr:hypothetical protein [Phycisphaerae bacterium]
MTSGDDQVVYAGDKVWLDATKSAPSAVMLEWSQTAGPNVLLSAPAEAPTFTAPGVAEETMLEFSLTASAGMHTDTDSTRVTVLPVPVVVVVPDAGGPSSRRAGRAAGRAPRETDTGQGAGKQENLKLRQRLIPGSGAPTVTYPNGAAVSL